ncbi:MAG TPA: hypothetical protein VEK79_08610 [Thermoanaerobaculia bacterium]|nr:hypothetical protein [Thermoanaerobaculia bacterium]
MAEDSNSGWGTGTGGSGTGSTGTTGGTSSGGGTIGSGTSASGGGSMGGGTGSGAGSFGVTSATDRGTGSELCPHCGQSLKGGGLEQFLGRLGITEDMINNLKTQFQNVEIDEYLNTARDYLKDSSGKATTYAKENPGKVAAGVAALALGAGLIYAATNRDKT